AAVRRPLTVVVRGRDPVADRALGGALQVDVDGEPQRVAGAWQHHRFDLARRPPARVDGQLRGAVASAEVRVVRALEPRLADGVGRLIALALAGLVLGLRDRADVAEDVRGERLVRVLAQVRVGELYARELELVLGEVRDRVRVDARLDDDRREGVARLA